MNSTDCSKLKILLVDDEPMIVKGLERALGLVEEEWELTLAYSGREGLERMKATDFDVVVSDLRMPEMDGAQFLQKAAQRQPSTLRIILSGYADHSMMLLASSSAHRHLSKPCEAETLAQVVRSAQPPQMEIGNKKIADIIKATSGLGSGHRCAQELLQIVDDPRCNLQELERFAQQRPAVHANILRLANSAYFNSSGEIGTLAEALHLLGLSTIRDIALLCLSRAGLQLGPEGERHAELIMNHCVQTSNCLDSLVSDPQRLARARSAATLHDLGKLTLLAYDEPGYLALAAKSAADRIPIYQLEREAYGCDHAGIAVCLFSLWGLPKPLLRCVAWHHKPDKLTEESAPSDAVLLHIANYLAYSRQTERAYFLPPANRALLPKAGIAKAGGHRTLQAPCLLRNDQVHTFRRRRAKGSERLRTQPFACLRTGSRIQPGNRAAAAGGRRTLCGHRLRLHDAPHERDRTSAEVARACSGYRAYHADRLRRPR